jgi:hypothetical protein
MPKLGPHRYTVQRAAADSREFRELQLQIFLDARALKVLIDINMTLLL